MNDLTSQPWFAWAVGLVIGLPVVLIVLTELHGWLVRRGNADGRAGRPCCATSPCRPAALLVLFTQVWELDGETTWVRDPGHRASGSC